MRAGKIAFVFVAASLVAGGSWLFFKPSPRDPGKVYQSGQAVGTVIGAREDQAHGTVFFEQIATAGLFDQFQDFEYRGYVLHIAQEDAIGSTRMAGKTSENFIHVTSRIAGKRS